MEFEVIGIDLGTTNSAMAFIEMDEPTIIENVEGEKTTPSVVYFRDNKEVVVGKVAKQNIISNADRTVKSIKRKMGEDFTIKIGKKKYPPEYISAHIIKKLVNDAENILERNFKDVVVSVPAYFLDAQRQATKDACDIAGMNVVGMINEPTAAALAYGFKEDEERRVLVYDFGGGTFDVSVLTIGGGFFDVDACGGDNHLGGDDIDDRLKDFILEKIKEEKKINIKKDLRVLQTLKELVESAKIQLSTNDSVMIDLPYIGKHSGSPIGFSYELKRNEFNRLIDDFVERTRGPMEQVLDDAALDPSDIDDILLVGGTTKIPLVYDFVCDFFGKEPERKVNPDEAVALGAALSGIKNVQEKTTGSLRRPVDISDVISRSFGVLTADGTVAKIIDRNTKIPILKTKPFTNAGDFVPEVIIPVYQGEDMFPDEEGYLGEFWIPIEPKPELTNKINVSFEIGSEFGILRVTARDKDSGNEKTVKLEAKGRLSRYMKNKLMEEMLKLHGVEVRVENIVSRDVLTTYLNPNSTIKDIKRNLSRKKIFSKEMALFYNNKVLNDNLFVRELGLEDGDILEINEHE